ncbi:cystathionine beta-lyase [Salmonella enterica subsp. arizonae]|uniref:Cystathionine beta-lyase n=1 Tax=Salmonella enterica subsp. arizonae TaxID=59203 RepID=A0A379TJV1_SALER|nr:cystathionine beta-lyase [Salmonella enterica subsp. arizonae]
MTNKQLDTKLVNAGRSKKYTLGSVNSVIQRASSLVLTPSRPKNMPPAIAPTANYSTDVGER